MIPKTELTLKKSFPGSSYVANCEHFEDSSAYYFITHDTPVNALKSDNRTLWTLESRKRGGQYQGFFLSF
jgi:hypothetical protein